MRERLQRVHEGLDYLNNVLLLPMTALLAVELSTDATGDTRRLLDGANLVFSALFLTEWALGLHLAADRRAYLRSPAALLDLVSALPFGLIFQGARVGRLLRLLRLVRVVAQSRRLRLASERLFRVGAMLGGLVAAGAISIRAVEPRIAPTLEDAVWFTLSTISTVGYGDAVPATSPGRLVAALLMLFGVAIYGYVAGFMAGLVEDPEEDEILHVVRRIEARLERLDPAGGASPARANEERADDRRSA